MANDDIIQTIDEKFAVALRNSLSNPILSEQGRDVFLRWGKIYLSLKEEKHKIVLYQLLGDYFASVECSIRFEKLQMLLPIVEKMQTAGVLDEAFEFADFLIKEKTMNLNEMDEAKARQQTANATASRRAYKNWKPIIKALWEYIVEVENKWHPVVPQDTPKAQRSASHSQKNSIKSVFKEHKEKIVAILQNLNLNGMEPEGAFARAFIVWTETCYERMPDHKTINGYSQEKRAPRSEASKERSRQGALRKQIKKD